MKNLYIKISHQELQENPSLVYADKELVEIGLKYNIDIKEGSDLGKYMVFWDIEGYRYLYIILRNIVNKNKCRNIPVTDAEIEDTLSYINKKGFVTVDSLPIQEEVVCLNQTL